MPKVTTASGKKTKIPYIPMDVPPSKARTGMKAGGKKGKMKGMMKGMMKGY